jgi:hypothetical protein
MPRAQIKDEKTYQKLRDEGESKEKAARIANAAAGSSRSRVGRKGGKSGSYQDWSKPDLVRRAREIGIKGRSTMSRAELIKASRDTSVNVQQIDRNRRLVRLLGPPSE